MRLPSVQSLLKKYEIRPKKRLGQNFLHAMPTMLKIVDALHTAKTDHVIEIGFGLGLMTSLLSERCEHVTAIDADHKMCEIARIEHSNLDNVEWIEGDILEFDFMPPLLCKEGRGEVETDILPPLTPPYKGGEVKFLVIGNIPYNISTPIFFHLIEHRNVIRRAVLLVQREVADRVAAAHGGKEYGALTVMMQAYARCKKLFNVARTNFIPQPDIESSAIEIDFDSMRDSAPVTPFFSMIVKAAFQKRRKTIRNALIGSQSLNLDAAKLDEALLSCKIDPKRRPETLSPDEFFGLAVILEK